MDVKVALAQLHFYEEPCISGQTGSGTVFFSGCNLSCKFCQNYEISQLGKGKDLSITELSDVFLDLQRQGANNINLVTGFMFAPHIVEAIKIARNKCLTIPIIYNSSGYESINTLKLLDGYIDIYLPDFKYFYNDVSGDLSDCPNYFDVATSAIKEMVRQVGSPIFDTNGLMKKGVMIRHLVLPSYISNSKRILFWIKHSLPNDIYISIMAQYFPTYKALERDDINRKLTSNEWEEIEKYIYYLNFQNGYVQDLEENEEQYVPKF